MGLDGPLVAGAQRHDGPHDIRDHVAGTFDDHRIADAHILALCVLKVVQRGVADDDAAQFNRLQDGAWGKRAHTPHLHVHVQEVGGLFAGRDFKSQCATRVPAHHS